MAKRHYHEKGTQRYFEIKIATRSQLETQQLKPLSEVYDGMFLLLLDDIEGTKIIFLLTK